MSGVPRMEASIYGFSDKWKIMEQINFIFLIKIKDIKEKTKENQLNLLN